MSTEPRCTRPTYLALEGSKDCRRNQTRRGDGNDVRRVEERDTRGDLATGIEERQEVYSTGEEGRFNALRVSGHLVSAKSHSRQG
jgi:hypothetical protein